MITILKSTDLGLEPIEGLADGTWVNLVNPGMDEVRSLTEEYQIPHDFLTSPLDLDERARSEREENALLIVLRIPFHQQGADVPFSTMPLGIVITDRVIITVSKFPNTIIEELGIVRTRGMSTTKRNRFVLQLFLKSAQKYLFYLREINRQVEILEDRLQMSLQNKEVLELLKYQKSLTYFTTALKSNELMMDRLQRSRIFHMYPDDEDLLEDVLTEIAQAIEMTKISSDILSQMMDAFASIISNNLNVVMKFLATVTIIIALPTLITSIYGMNVDLPFQDADFAFWIAMGASVALMGATAWLFIRMDWL